MKLAVVTRRNDDGTYLAVCPSLPCCVTKGASVQEVLRKHEEAIRGHVASVTNFVPGEVHFQVIQAT